MVELFMCSLPAYPSLPVATAEMPELMTFYGLYIFRHD